MSRTQIELDDEACRAVMERYGFETLIAAVAVRAEVPVLHPDQDFEVLARCTSLRMDRNE